MAGPGVSPARTLVPDPFRAAGELTSKDKQWLDSTRLLSYPLQPGWQLVPFGP